MERYLKEAIKTDWPPWQYVDRIDHASPWLTGNSLALRCRYSFNYRGFEVNDSVDNDWAFVKTDFLPYYKRIRLNKTVPVSAVFFHNSDAGIRIAPETGDEHWYAANAEVDHHRVHGIALSIGYPPQSHGDVSIIKRVIDSPFEKDTMFYANFDLGNNRKERQTCLDYSGVKLNPGRSFEDYLTELRQSYFCLAPKGNGIDTHRTWESLIVGTIPIVTSSITARDHKDYPIIVLNDWKDFKKNRFTPQRYADIWGDRDPETFYKELYLDNYLNRLRERFGLES